MGVEIKYTEVGICGLGCRLCPWYQKEGENKCGGCKSEYRMGVGCSIINCALKKKGVEFCGDCDESPTCERWARTREFGKSRDSFKCYQKLEEDIAEIIEYGKDEFDRGQKHRERLLRELLTQFNEGRSKGYYCIAATVLEIKELEDCLEMCRKESPGHDVKERARMMHAALDEVARARGYQLKLRK